MEFGDIIYFILLVFFMILGFFNDSRKKKKQQEQLEEETTPPDYSADERREGVPSRSPRPPVPFPDVSRPSIREKRTEFQSSVDQVTNYEKYSSGDSITFDYDAGSLDDTDDDIPMSRRELSRESIQTPASVNKRTSDGKRRGTPHPYLADLYRDDSINALRAGLIYSEILQRKY